MRSTRFITLALSAALVLAGCASLEPADSSESSRPAPTASASPSAEPVQERETGLTRPAAVFGADCGAVFADAELASVMGTPMTIGPNHFTEFWGGGPAIDQAGGLMCRWEGSLSIVVAVVLPDAALDDELTEQECSRGEWHDMYPGFCGLEQITNGLHLSALVSQDADVAVVAAQRDALRAIFIEGALTQTPVPVPIPASGSWVLPPNCEAVVAGADLSAVPGLGAASTGGPGGGYGKQGPPAEFAIVAGWSPPSCTIIGESAYVEFVPIGGHRWKEQEIAARADATPLNIDGVDAAYSVPGYFYESTLVYVFSGPNMLLFSVKYLKNAGGIATALIASLDATAVK